jgi:hypothetical protein
MGAECDLRSMYSKFKRLTLGVQRDLEHARANENQLEEEHNQQIEVEVEVSAALQLGKRKKKKNTRFLWLRRNEDGKTK